MSKMLRGKTLKAIEKFLLSHVRKPFGCVLKGSWGRGGEERGGLWVGRRPSPGTDLHCARCCIISDNLQSLFLEPWTGGWGGGGGRGARGGGGGGDAPETKSWFVRKTSLQWC